MSPIYEFFALTFSSYFIDVVDRNYLQLLKASIEKINRKADLFLPGNRNKTNHNMRYIFLNLRVRGKLARTLIMQRSVGIRNHGRWDLRGEYE